MRVFPKKKGSFPYLIQTGYGAMTESRELNEYLSRNEPGALVISSRVYNLHRKYIESVFGRYRHFRLFVIQDTEENKNYTYAGRLLEEFAAAGMNRSSMVWSVGGGVTGDMAGFCAAVYMRGIPFVQCPTTLLAMVDASIGGKTGVNLGMGKNMAGVFHQPSLVVCDTKFLETLELREIRSGLGEIVKHGLLGDRETLKILENNTIETITAPETIEEVAALSGAFKASVVAQDEQEHGIRAILNLGHTTAHAVESFLEYRSVTHGEAVAAGIAAEGLMSVRTGLMDPESLIYIKDLLNRYGLIRQDIKLPAEKIYEHMKFDKKNHGGNIKFSLLKEPGEPVTDRNVPEEIILSSLRDTLG